jgi:hypothetical protein
MRVLNKKNRDKKKEKKRKKKKKIIPYVGLNDLFN